jgi:hypothetical protein
MTTRLVRKESCLRFAAIPDRSGRVPALRFLATLDARGKGQFASLARLMDRAHAGGFDFSGRVSKIRGSGVGLLELRLTPRRGVSPHLRLFGVIRGDVVYLAYGYAKKKKGLDRSVVAKSERLVADWEARNDPPLGRKTKKGGKATHGRRA